MDELMTAIRKLGMRPLDQTPITQAEMSHRVRLRRHADQYPEEPLSSGDGGVATMVALASAPSVRQVTTTVRHDPAHSAPRCHLAPAKPTYAQMHLRRMSLVGTFDAFDLLLQGLLPQLREGELLAAVTLVYVDGRHAELLYGDSKKRLEYRPFLCFTPGDLERLKKMNGDGEILFAAMPADLFA